MTIDRVGRFLILGQALDCVTFLVFWLLFGALITRLGGSLSDAETNPLVSRWVATFGLLGFVVLKLGAPVAAAAWPWHPERHRSRLASRFRAALMVGGAVAGLVGATFNVLAIVQAGSVLW